MGAASRRRDRGDQPVQFPAEPGRAQSCPGDGCGEYAGAEAGEHDAAHGGKVVRGAREAGFPAGAINLVVGSGSTVGEWLITDPRVDKITFTGSPPVGRHITQVAGIKKITLELGNTSPVIIAPDADLDFVAKRCAVGAYYNSGQVCISVQRIYSQREVYEPFTEKFVKASEAMIVGDPLDERVDVGPMIDPQGSRPHRGLGERSANGRRAGVDRRKARMATSIGRRS